MAIAHEFDYAKPATLSQALELLNSHQTKAKILAGGTDLIVNIKEGMCSPSLLIDIKDLGELCEIKQEAGYICIGAGISFSQILDSELIKQNLPMLWMLRQRLPLPGSGIGQPWQETSFLRFPPWIQGQHYCATKQLYVAQVPMDTGILRSVSGSKLRVSQHLKTMKCLLRSEFQIHLQIPRGFI
jgi:hypothetical protein